MKNSQRMNKSMTKTHHANDFFAMPFIWLFCVTLFFVAVFPEKQKIGLPVELPKTNAAALIADEGAPAVITMLADGSSSFENRTWQKDNIPDELGLKLKDRRVFLRADENVRFGSVVKLLAWLERQNVSVSIVAQEK